MCCGNILSLSVGHTLHWGVTGLIHLFIYFDKRSCKSLSAVEKETSAVAAEGLTRNN